jgi:GT2 family glycosyltransferase
VSPQSATCLPGWRIGGTLEATLADCCLILATYRRPNEICALLQSVNAMPHRPAEVVVVDGSPERDTEKIISEWISNENVSFDLTYARCPAGLTRQRNAGIDLSSRKYVFFLDDDCLPQGDYFSQIRHVFVDDVDSRVGAVSGLIVNEMSSPISFRWRVRLSLRLVPRIEPGTYHPSGTSVPLNLIAPFSGVKPIDTLSGCTMTFRRSVFEQYRFSEFFSGYAQGEDLEMSLRIRRRYTLLWCGDARVVHNHAKGGRPASFSKGVMEVRNRYFIWKRHSSDAALSDRLRFWLDVAFLLGVDVASFSRRPSRRHLSHAMGLCCGAVNSIFAPAVYAEPRAQKQYELKRWSDSRRFAPLER